MRKGKEDGGEGEERQEEEGGAPPLVKKRTLGTIIVILKMGRNSAAPQLETAMGRLNGTLEQTFGKNLRRDSVMGLRNTSRELAQELLLGYATIVTG